MALLEDKHLADAVLSGDAGQGRSNGKIHGPEISRAEGMLGHTKLTLSLHQRRQYREETAAMKNIHLCFPPMEGQVNCMHSKLMLLFHPNYLRIAVPTANLTAVDWGEHSLMENVSAKASGMGLADGLIDCLPD